MADSGYEVQSRPQTPARRQSGTPQRQSRPVSSYAPVGSGEATSNSVTVLEAEFFGCIFLIFLTVFTDSSASYSAKMLAVMKRGTLATVLFFVLALFSASGPNAARVAKAFGALVLAGIFLGTAGQGTISALDSFFKADWKSGSTTEGDSSSQAGAGQQIGAPDSLANMGAEASGVPGNILSQLRSGIDKINQILGQAIGNLIP